jgi:hypothetical protein
MAGTMRKQRIGDGREKSHPLGNWYNIEVKEDNMVLIKNEAGALEVVCRSLVRNQSSSRQSRPKFFET